MKQLGQSNMEKLIQMSLKDAKYDKNKDCAYKEFCKKLDKCSK